MAIMIAKSSHKADKKRLGAMLLVALVLTIWVLLKDDAEDTDMIELVDTKQARRTAPANSTLNKIKQSGPLNSLELVQDGIIPWQKLQRQPLSNKVNDIFKVHSWLVVPKVVKTKAPPPPPPVAPPAPFNYLGKLEGSPKGTQVFLMSNGVLISVVKGEKINQQWRLDSQDDTTLRLTYLPLNQSQILSKTQTTAGTVLPGLTLESNPGLIRPQPSQPEIKQPDISKPSIDSLDIDPPDTSELGLEELKL